MQYKNKASILVPRVVVRESRARARNRIAAFSGDERMTNSVHASPNDLPSGTHITVLHEGRVVCGVVLRWETPTRTIPFSLPNALAEVGPSLDRRVWLADEGIEWMRGWHEPDSPEVRALRAASMLVHG
jgi:hypothetical protein